MKKEQLMQQGFSFYVDPTRSKEAAAYFEKAIKIDPNYINGYFWLAYCLWEYTSDWEKAEKIAYIGLKINPKRADLHLVLAWIIERLRGYTSDYEKELRKTIELEPTWIAPRGCLIDYLINKNEIDQARKETLKALKYKQDNIEVPKDKIEWIYENFITGKISTFWGKYLLDAKKTLGV